jgi:hypothetical protein
VFGRLRGRPYSFMHGLFGMVEFGQSLHFSEPQIVYRSCRIVGLAHAKKIANIQNKIFHVGRLYHRFHAPEKTPALPIGA